MEDRLDRIEELLSALRETTPTRGDLAELQGGIDLVRDDLGRLDGRLGDLTGELALIRRRLDRLDNAVGTLTGFSRQLDALKARLGDIEQHLGIGRKIV